MNCALKEIPKFALYSALNETLDTTAATLLLDDLRDVMNDSFRCAILRKVGLSTLAASANHRRFGRPSLRP